MTLDHVIAVVPDIRATHGRLLGRGFEEAWPIGPFWPAAQTSGLALGGLNLELVQPDSGVVAPRIETLVLAPTSYAEGWAMAAPFAPEDREKIEPDPELLALRGFPPEMRREPQAICRNLYPSEGETPYPFFLCLYAPFLKARLAAANFAQPHGLVTGLSLVAPDPERVRHLFAGRLGPIGLDVEAGERPEVSAIRFGEEYSLGADDL